MINKMIEYIHMYGNIMLSEDGGIFQNKACRIHRLQVICGSSFSICIIVFLT